MSLLLTPFRWFYTEFGLHSVYHTGRDAWLIILGRTSRMFAYGATSLIIALFFSALDFSDLQIGLFMTLTLAGDVLLSLSLTLVADRLGRRRVLLAGAVLMILSGGVFVVSENYALLLGAAVIGIISATGGDFGPFRAIEESTISHLTTSGTRSDVLSWYVTTSSLGSAAGNEFSGRAVDFLQTRDGWEIKHAYHAMFWLYILMGVMNIITVVLMSDKCEIADTPSQVEPVEASEALLDERQQQFRDPDNNDDDNDVDDDPANDLDDLDPAPSQPPETSPRKSLFTQISTKTRSIMYKLWFLLIVDSLADGMVNISLTYYYMDLKLHLSKSTLGDLASTSSLLASCSTIFAGPLARRLGLINTMVFTHLPSSLAVLLFPIPQGVFMTVVLLYIRNGLNNMDQAPRSAFIAAVVRPEERTAVMGITSMLRTLAATVGPSITGALAGTDKFWIAFVVAGLLRICYDLGLFALFVNMKIETRGAEEVDGDARRVGGGEEEVELGVVERGMK